MSKKVSAPKQLEWAFENVLLLERLREVNALIGFTRVEAPDEGQEDEAAPKLLSPGTNQTLFQHLKCMVRGYLLNSKKCVRGLGSQSSREVS